MPSAVLEMDLSQLASELDRQGVQLTDVDLTKCWGDVGLRLRSWATECFDQGVTPEGTPWAPLRRTSRKRGGPGAKPLRHTGQLMASVLGMGGQHREEATPHQLIWGTNVNYASYHQLGTRFIPARPFLGLTEHMIREIELMVLDFIEGQGNA